MSIRINCLLMLLVLALINTGCSEDSTSAECVTSEVCETYTTCVGGSCVPQNCTSSIDCPTTDVCVQNPEGEFLCTAIECTTNDNCLTGEICISNVCVSTASGVCLGEGESCLFANDCCSKNCDPTTKLCVPDASCLTNEDCDEGLTCNAETGDCEETSEECSEDTCPDGVCNPETGLCEETGDLGTYICLSCETDAECGDAGSCLELSAQKHCFPACEADKDCTTGFECIPLDVGGLRCVPETKTCAISCIAGCPEGQFCNQITQECVTPAPLCSACQYDYECGEGNRCAAFGGISNTICVPQCTDGQSCNTGGSCDSVDGLEVCLPLGDECCFGPECEGACGNNVCGGEKPFCLDDTTCVQCLATSDCDADCTCEGNACVCPDDVCGGCIDPQVCDTDSKECVECISNDQCDVASGQFCNESTNTCEVDICAACVDPYPACAEINGQTSCVQCVEDADCASGDCNETTYFCEGNSGILSDTCKCSSDSDCPTGTQFNLKCDTNLGLCYDIDGNCDGISACCDVASGSECIPQLELIASGIELPLPNLGGSTGVCGCTSNDLICNLTDSCGNGNCPGGIQCSANIFGLLLGGLSGAEEFPADFCGEFSL